ncbi:hypothetical protein C5Y41_17635 [Rahnella variigena]|nr:hypothetical protein C5Y41_17635 [Rahnella variigena]
MISGEHLVSYAAVKRLLLHKMPYFPQDDMHNLTKIVFMLHRKKLNCISFKQPLSYKKNS